MPKEPIKMRVDVCLTKGALNLLCKELKRLRVENAKLRSACHVFIEARKHHGYGMNDAERAIREALK